MSVEAAFKAKFFDRKWAFEFPQAVLKGLEVAAENLHSIVQREVSVPNPTGKTPSEPGEPPRKITGVGRDGIVWESNDSTRDPATRVGSRGGTRHGFYMIFLELGTENIAPRPWLLNTFMKNRKRMGVLAVRGGQGRLRTR